MARKRPSICKKGHALRRLASAPSGWSISYHGNCFVCGDGQQKMARGGSKGGSISKRRKPGVDKYGSGHHWRCIRTLFSSITPRFKAANVLFVESFAGVSSRTAAAAAFLGMAVLRIAWSADPHIPDLCSTIWRESEVPTLACGVACTWLLDLSQQAHRNKLRQFIFSCVTTGAHAQGPLKLKRLALHTSPPCTPWCKWTSVNRGKAKKKGHAAIMAYTRKRKRTLADGATLIRFTRKLHAGAERLCIRERTDFMGLHEQPDRARMPSDFHTEPWNGGEQVWPTAFVNINCGLVKVAGCEVGLANARGELMHKKWRFQVRNCINLERVLSAYTCSHNGKHATAEGADTQPTQFYTCKLAATLATGALY